MFNSKGCHRKLMLKGGDIFLTKGRVCKDQGICEVAVIDASRQDHGMVSATKWPLYTTKQKRSIISLNNSISMACKHCGHIY